MHIKQTVFDYTKMRKSGPAPGVFVYFISFPKSGSASGARPPCGRFADRQPANTSLGSSLPGSCGRLGGTSPLEDQVPIEPNPRAHGMSVRGAAASNPPPREAAAVRAGPHSGGQGRGRGQAAGRDEVPANPRRDAALRRGGVREGRARRLRLGHLELMVLVPLQRRAGARIVIVLVVLLVISISISGAVLS